MIFMLPAPNIHEARGRVAGHKFTPTSRESLKSLKPLVPRLKELGVEAVICADLDGASGEYLGRRLNVPVEEWESLRRWNWGKLHGVDTHEAEKVLVSLERPEIPVKGGDSRASFNKRMGASRERLAVARRQVLVIAQRAVLGALLGQDTTSLVNGRVYEAQLGATSQAVV